MSDLNLDDYPAGTAAVLAALADRRADNAHAAVPETQLAVDAGLDRETARQAATALAEDGHLGRRVWTDGDEQVSGYYIDDLRVRRQGRELAAEQALASYSQSEDGTH